jgi:hypothetical protein
MKRFYLKITGVHGRAPKKQPARVSITGSLREAPSGRQKYRELHFWLKTAFWPLCAAGNLVQLTTLVAERDPAIRKMLKIAAGNSEV